MQFGLSALFAAVTAATTVVAQVSSGYILTAIPGSKGPALTSYWTTVAAYNGGLYIGEAKRDYSSEPFIFNAQTGGGVTGVSFTSWRQTPTGWVNLYLYPNDLKAPGFNSPHSAGFPTGADPWNFTIGTDGFFRYKNTNRWHACPVDGKAGYYQIIYVGGSNKAPATCTPVALKVSSYGQCA